MLKVYIQALWPREQGEIFWPFDFIIPDVQETNNYDECDICIIGDFASNNRYLKTYRNNILHIHFSFENFNIYNRNHWLTDYKIPKKHLLVGCHAPSNTSIYFPYWLYEHSILNNIDKLEKNDDDFEFRYDNGISSMYHMKYNHRVKIINHYKAKRLNTNHLNHQTEMNRDRKKESVIKKYLFDLAIENSKDFGGYYITEKIVNSIIAGCIPIYWGGNLNYTPFNQKRIFTIHDLNNLPSIQLDKSQLKDIYYMPLLNNNYIEMRDELLNRCKKMILDLL